MATPMVYKNCKIYSGAYDISGMSNRVETGYAYEKKPAVVFGNAVRHNLPGLAEFTFEVSGHAYSDGSAGSDDILWGRFPTADVPMTFCPQTGAAGEVGYTVKSLMLQYETGGAVGDVYPFTASGVGENVKLVRGTMMSNTSITTTSNGTAYQVGAVSATQYLYCTMHVTAVSGTSPTLDVIVESDDAENFASGTTRATFTQATAIGSEALTPVAGAITDDWWRVGFTIGGTDTPTFTVAIIVGIL